MTVAATVAERYLVAANSDDLRLDEKQQRDADRLLAAGYAGRQSEWGALGLRVYRLRASGGMAGARQIAEALGDQLMTHLAREAMARHAGAARVPRLERVTAADVAMTVLKWMQRPACPTCEGRTHPRIAGTPKLDVTRDCPACLGTGVVPLERLVRPEHIEPARWLANRLERACADAFGDMGRLLRAA